jgi:hypothetical protein
MLAAIILAGNLAGLAWTTGRTDDQPPPPKPTEKNQSGEAIQEAGLVQTTCKYDTAMLVVVSKHGAAGVRFIDPFELGNKSGNGIVGVSYEWRFQGRKTGMKEQTGTGRVYAKLVNSNVRDGSFSVKCGPVHFTWSYKDKRLSVIQYNPRDLGVHPVALRHFAKIQAPPEVEAIDLRRFLQPKDARAFRTAEPVLYSKGVIVVRDANGIATFEFGKTFERRKGETQTLYGVPYHFTFLSPEGKTKEGDGEVYERYTN